MTTSEIDTLVETAQGYFPKWKPTPFQAQAVATLLGKHAAESAMHALHVYAVENLDRWEPNWNAISKAVRDEADSEGWGMGAETQLAYLQDEYRQRGDSIPDDDWLILNRMGRKSPGQFMRDRARQDVAKCYAGTGCDGTLPAIRRLQDEAIQARARMLERVKTKVQ